VEGGDRKGGVVRLVAKGLVSSVHAWQGGVNEKGRRAIREEATGYGSNNCERTRAPPPQQSSAMGKRRGICPKKSH